MRAAFTALAILLAVAGSVRAHPVPSNNHDRTIVVRLLADAVEVDYRLEMDETRAALDLPRAESASVSSRRDFTRLVLRFHSTALAENLDARLDGRPLDFACVASSCEITDHLRCDFRFRAVCQPAPGRQHTFAFREGNYHDDDSSALRLTLGASGRVTLLRIVTPDDKLLARPASERKPGDGERLRLAAATFVVADDEPRAIYKPALPPDLEARDGSGAKPSARAKPSEVVAWNRPYSEAIDQERDEASPQTLLDLLLDTRRGFVVLLWLAAGLGAAHALTPGHGKTLAAAYLVGERGTVWHALLLGLVTTVTHTAAVLTLAILLNAFFPNTSRVSVQIGLELVSGLLVTGLGLWLLLVRLAGQADHVHLGGSHDHVHSHGGHSHSLPDLQPGWRGLVILGVSGGIVPCWDAMAILAGTVAKQRLWMAPPLLLAFSAGLASVLVAVGVMVVQAKKWADMGLGGRTWFRRIERVLPLASAVVVTAMGVWLCYESLHPAGG